MQAEAGMLPLVVTGVVASVQPMVPRELEQLLVVQISEVTLPVSWLSGSLKVAVRVGVAVLRRGGPGGGGRPRGGGGAVPGGLVAGAPPAGGARGSGRWGGAARYRVAA